MSIPRKSPDLNVSRKRLSAYLTDPSKARSYAKYRAKRIARILARVNRKHRKTLKALAD